MEKIFNYFSMFWGFVIGVVIHVLGGADVMLKTLITLIVLDYGTGVLKAIYHKKLNSTVGWKGIIKKVVMLFVVAASVSLQGIIQMPVREVIITFFICNEGISLLENAGELIPIPEQIKNALEKIKDNNISKLND